MAIKKSREQHTQERNERIADMTLDELKPYLCMKNYQNPAKCEGCPSISGCTAGQRAVLLIGRGNISRDGEPALEPQITPEKQVGQETEQEQPMPRAKRQYKFRHITESEVKEAFASGDPIKWVMDKFGRDRKSTIKLINFWADRHPDWAVGYKRLTKAERIKENGRKRSEAAMKKFKEALEADNPFEYLMRTYQMTEIQAHTAMANWRKRYKVLQQEESVMEDETSTAEETDEISLNDFLDEVEADAAAIDEQPVMTPVVKGDGTDIYGELNYKFYIIEQRESKIREQIEQLNKELELCEKQKDALALVANMFNPNTAIGKSLCTA